LLRLLGQIGRIGPHVGDQPDGLFLPQFETFVELLGDGHRPTSDESQATGGLLLQSACSERRQGAPNAGTSLGAAHPKRGVLQVLHDRLDLIAGGELRRTIVDPQQTRAERRRLLGGKEFASIVGVCATGDSISRRGRQPSARRLNPAGRQATGTFATAAG
jgi:hypothetical protein